MNHRCYIHADCRFKNPALGTNSSMFQYFKAFQFHKPIQGNGTLKPTKGRSIDKLQHDTSAFNLLFLTRLCQRICSSSSIRPTHRDLYLACLFIPRLCTSKNKPENMTLITMNLRQGICPIYYIDMSPALAIQLVDKASPMKSGNSAHFVG